MKERERISYEEQIIWAILFQKGKYAIKIKQF